jgi:hypothetical protein
LTAADTDEHYVTMRLCNDCADMCALTAKLVGRNGPTIAEVCKACAEVCEKCGASCKKHDDEMMKECAKSCENCATSCRKMAAAMKTTANVAN